MEMGKSKGVLNKNTYFHSSDPWGGIAYFSGFNESWDH